MPKYRGRKSRWQIRDPQESNDWGIRNSLTRCQCSDEGREQNRPHQYMKKQDLIATSKKLSLILRHKGRQMDIGMGSDGFVDVCKLLRLGRFRGCTMGVIQQIVAQDSKQRFALRVDPRTGHHQIRANQGHSFSVDNLELREIKSSDQIPMAVHGTYEDAWYNHISHEGLRRMNRQYIHMAIGLPNDRAVKSGMRYNVQVLIFVDVMKALKDGYKFFLSENNVVLCPGDEDGLLPKKYFEKVIDKRRGWKLPF